MKILSYLSSISHSTCEEQILNEMIAYRDLRISDEFKKKYRREAELEAKGVSKIEEWNKDILNTIFLWHKDVIILDYKLDEQFTMETLKTYVEEGKIKRHREYTGCYYLPLEEI